MNRIFLVAENFKQGEIGEPIMQTELEPGDVLYFPRGIIHQAEASPDTHSLHITVSTSQRNTWGDLLTTVSPLFPSFTTTYFD